MTDETPPPKDPLKKRKAFYDKKPKRFVLSNRPGRPRGDKSEQLVVDGKRPKWAFKLDEREYLFVLGFGRHMNGMAAAREAGYTKASAQNMGAVLMARPHVREAIHEMHAHMLPVIKVSMLERLAIIASANIADYMEWDERSVTVKRRRQIDRQKLLAVKSIEEKRTQWGSTVKLELYNPMEAMDRMAKLLDMIPKDFADADKASAGSVTVVIEGLSPQEHPTVTIDHEQLQQSFRDNREPDPDEKPPGA